MPTGGSARFASPLNVWDFVKIVSLVALDGATAQALSPKAAALAEAEGLDAHAHAARLRLSRIPPVVHLGREKDRDGEAGEGST
jgi:histidinol dehydrogenase